MSLSPSFEKINYYLRPNKQVERKVIIDILLHFRKYVDLNKFKYVGMGSIYYYDFILIHKLLGIKKLISFDAKTTTKRFKFNKPYDFIEFQNKLSTDFLADYNWKSNSIIWLDYDSIFC